MPITTPKELKAKIEEMPNYIYIVINNLWAWKNEDQEGFGKWWNDLNIGQTLKEEIAEKMNTLLPKINIGKEPNLNNQVDFAMDAMRKYNNPPVLFKRCGDICKIVEVNMGQYGIVKQNDHAIQHVVAKSSIWISGYHENGKPNEIYPPQSVIKAITALGEWPLPWLLSLTSIPIIRPNGAIHTTPGYDEVTHFYYQPKEGDKLPEFPDKPTKEDAEKAGKFIYDEVFGDFPFVDEASKTNVMAALITPIVRSMIDGCTPMMLFDKVAPGTGATLLAKLIGIIMKGAEPDFIKDPGTEEEWRKSIYALLYGGRELIIFDNIDASLSSSTLSATLTTQNVEGRILGQSKAVSIPNSAVWMATGNHCQIAGDMQRRVCLIQLEANEAEPWTRPLEDFRHPDLIKWVKAHRMELLGKVYTMVRAWTVAGFPDSCAPAMGSFEEWTSAVGGILRYAGFMNFMKNSPNIVALDSNAELCEAFMEAWYEKFTDKEKSSQEIVNWIISDEDLRTNLPDELSAAMEKTSCAKALGLALNKKQKVRYNNGLQLLVTKDTHKKVNRFKVKKYKDQSL
jgi:hypothetical protein